MRRYTLASVDARSQVDLRKYRQTIVDAVHALMPSAVVDVQKDCYYVSPTPKQGDAVKIGRIICKSALSKHCVHIPKLFSSVEVSERKGKINGRKKKQSGGHF